MTKTIGETEANLKVTLRLKLVCFCGYEVEVGKDAAEELRIHLAVYHQLPVNVGPPEYED